LYIKRGIYVQSIETEKEEEEAGHTTKDLLEALKASLKVKSKPTSSTSTAVAKQKTGVYDGVSKR
jgi:non-homologous end joining protein Ku